MAFESRLVLRGIIFRDVTNSSANIVHKDQKSLDVDIVGLEVC